MIPIPNPLHPAVVHFPIVLILIGAAVACAAVVVNRWNLPVIAAVLLGLGAIGAITATITGEQEYEMAGEVGPAAENLLEEHEEWGENTRNLAIAAAVVAAAAALLGRFPMAARGAGSLAALLAIAAAFAVVQTGHAGGKLVYKHGIGVNTLAGAAENTGAAENAGEEGTARSPKKEKGHHEEDDD